MSSKQMNKYTLVIKKGRISHKILLEKSSVCCQKMDMVATAFRTIWHYLMIQEISTVCDSALSLLGMFRGCARVHQTYRRMFFVALFIRGENQK